MKLPTSSVEAAWQHQAAGSHETEQDEESGMTIFHPLVSAFGETMRVRFLVKSLMALSAVVVSPALFADPPRDEMGDARLFTVSRIAWQDGSPSLPKGAKVAVLEGDPNAEGPFVFRVKLPDGYRITPHTHPKTERITVISGTFNLGMGDTFDEKVGQAMPTGTYGHWPAGMKHFVWATRETVIQFHGMGPWSIRYVNPDDDPRNKKKD